jgi:SAM-dependent methyltransferase
MHDDEQDIFFGIINRFIGYFTRDSQRLSQNDPESEYPFVPMDTRQVFEQLKFVHAFLIDTSQTSAEPLSFLDIGCGIGNVLLIAELMEFQVEGLEKDEYPFTVAAKLIGQEKVIQQDIWEYDHYHTFDVIYYFRPFHEGNLERRFERFIEDHLKPGGVLIANRKMDHGIDTDPRFCRLHPELPIWQKA